MRLRLAILSQSCLFLPQSSQIIQILCVAVGPVAVGPAGRGAGRLGRLVKGLPADLEAIVMRCLTKDPDGRFQNVGAVEAALAECKCAGLWTTESANAWWERNFGVDHRKLEVPSTFESNGAATRGAVSCVLDACEAGERLD